MLNKTRGIVLRAVKYGESSLICTVFTELYGVQSYMVQGVRSTKSRTNRSGLLQPCSLLDMVVYQRPQQNLQRIREFQQAHIYTNLHEEVVKNSIGLFSVELLLRLLPEHATMAELFDFAYKYFVALDKMPIAEVANFPVYFVIECSRLLGYEINGQFSEKTPYANLQEGAFTGHPSAVPPYLSIDDAQILDRFLRIRSLETLKDIEVNAPLRFRLLEWFIAFLHAHTQHLGNIRSLAVLQAILH